MNKKVVGAIRCFLENKVFHIVANETLAYAIWKKLKEIFAKNLVMKKTLLMRRLVNLKLKEGWPIREHLNDF